MPRRSDVLRKLRKTRSELTPILVAAAVEVEKINTIFDDLETNGDIADFEIYLEKLQVFKESDVYRSFMDIWTARGPEWWANMTNLGETNLRPFKLLRAASKPLRAAWRKTNGKTKNSSESDPIGGDLEGRSLQPEGGGAA